MVFRRKFLIAIVFIGLITASIILFVLPPQYTVPILMYHHIRQSSLEDRLSVSPLNFKKQMDFLSKMKYQVISLEELINYIENKKPLPHNLVVITIDDGYQDNYSYAFPSLKENGLPAAIFLITDKIGQEGFLSWPEIKEMAANKVEIGSHTQRHPYLCEVNDEKILKEEIFGSKKLIEAELKRPVKFFCYPSGNMNNLVKEIVIQSGYLGACATHPGNKYAKYDIYALRRIRISNSDNLFAFWVKISGYYTLFKEKK